MEILYSDDRVLVCVKPAGVLSTDEPGGLPELLRRELGADAAVRTVHRLDRAVAGLMVLARTARAAGDLSEQIRKGQFQKEYLALVEGIVPASGTLEDRLLRDKARKMTVVSPQGQPSRLSYRVLGRQGDRSLVRIRLETGRTHQIRVQFASRGWPLVGDRKYGRGGPEGLRLWSCRLAFFHPRTGEAMAFEMLPPWLEEA